MNIAKSLVFKNNSHTLTVDVRLKDGELSLMGMITDRKGREIAGGQVLDELDNYDSPLAVEVKEVWQRWHLNDMRAGTPKQEKAIKEFVASERTKNRYAFVDYDEQCKHLESIGLLVDKLDNGSDYKYGSGWLKEELPAEIVEKIKAW